MSNPLVVPFEPSETQCEFIESTALENCLVGPRGEGKSDGGIMAMSYHASLQEKSVRPIPWAIVRDTWKNLERTTLRSFLYPSPGSFMAQVRNRLRIRDGGRQVELPGVWIAFLFGVDTPDDVNQLQSMQLGGLWLEEAAPAMQEEVGRGIGEEVWMVGLTSLRAPVTTGRRAQITENYPSEDHWTWIRFNEDPTPQQALFQIPRGENEHVDPQYRENMEKALKGRPDLLDRLVFGRPAHVQIGIAVTPEYNASVNAGPWHRSDRNLDPMPNVPVFRFWDGDLHPACVFAQWTPRGKFMVTDTLRGIETGMGMKQFLDQQVKPLIANRYSKIDKWRDLGDPTLRDRDPSDSSKTAANIIEIELGTYYEGGVLRWPSRKEALKYLLTQKLTEAEPMFVVSKHERLLHRALSGGWHYNKSSSGKVSDEPDNDDINSHPAAGLSHGIAKLFKYERESRYILPAPKRNIAIASAVGPLHEARR